ncbi:conserved hypothetical protein [Desulfovibrionales bacterium]
MDRKSREKRGPLHKPIQNELIEIEECLIKLLTKRGRLLAKARQLGPRSGQARQEVDLDKRLWQLWESRAPKDAADVKLWRTFFTLLQELTPKGQDRLNEHLGHSFGQRAATTIAETDDKSPRSFLLTPRQDPTELYILGPGCLTQTRLFTILAAQAKQPAHVAGIIVNDPLVELIKALNQVGGNLYWDASSIKGRGVQELDFDNKVIYCGNDPLNAYLLLALAITKPIRCKIAGGPGVHTLDLAAFRRLAPHLGGRLAGVAPGAPSLPIRLEASAVPADAIPLPDDLPPLAAMAIAVAAPAYIGGLSLRWSSHGPYAAAIEAALGLAAKTLEQCGVPLIHGPGFMNIDASVPALPVQPIMTLDPWISAALLALPRLHKPGRPGGKSHILGLWPTDLAVWQEADRLLTAVGLTLVVDSKGACTTVAKNPAVTCPHILDAAIYPEGLPLAVVLAAAMTLANQEPAILLAKITEQDRAVAGELLERVNLILAPAQTPGLSNEIWTVVRNNTLTQNEPIPWPSPTSFWTIAYALIAHLQPGLRLLNPGSMTELLPKFWTLFNSLPKAPHDILFQQRRAPEEQRCSEHPKRRRIRT